MILSESLILVFRHWMFGFIRHRSLLQRNVSLNVGKLTNHRELVPKKTKLTKLTRGTTNENQITAFNEKGAPITLTQYSEIELEDMIEEGKIEAEDDTRTPIRFYITVAIWICAAYYHYVPPEGIVKLRI